MLGFHCFTTLHEVRELFAMVSTREEVLKMYIEWINNKVLLYSMGKYIQYPVINHNRKEYEKECVYIYV